MTDDGFFNDPNDPLRRSKKQQREDAERRSGLRKEGFFRRPELHYPENRKKSVPSEEPKKACFIATAAFKSADAPEVEVLRDYRDTVLCGYAIGRLFVKVYYSLSPAIAQTISMSETMTKLARSLLIPFVRYAGRRKTPKWEDHPY